MRRVGLFRGAFFLLILAVLVASPFVPLLMMAASVKHIVASGGILDTLLHWASTAINGACPFAAALRSSSIGMRVSWFPINQHPSIDANHEPCRGGCGEPGEGL